MTTISPSALRAYEECPRCFWRHVNLRERRPETHFPSIANGMDLRVKKYFDYHRRQNTTPLEIQGTGAALFKDTGLLREWRDAQRGLRWQTPAGHTVMGALDDLLEKDGKVIVLDYKTKGWPVKPDDPARHQPQLDIYTMLLRKMGRATEDYGYLLFYVPEMVRAGGEVRFQTDLRKVAVDPARAETRCLDALTLLGGPMPASSAACGYCAWAKKQ